MRTFIGPDIILSDLTEGPTLFAQSDNVYQLCLQAYYNMLMDIISQYQNNHSFYYLYFLMKQDVF